MKIEKLLESLDFSPAEEELKRIRKYSEEIVEKLKKTIRKEKISAEVFVGGSFAKNTLVKKEKQDIDIYIRFDPSYDDLSKYLERIVKKAFRGRIKDLKKIHGSRDYFIFKYKGDIYFEIIPVLKINHPRESRNVTDLSYFHVKYVRKKMKKKNLSKEIAIAKTFCRAQEVYGAESYIQGFSGYALECLIIYYKSFSKMIRELAKVKQRIILDPEKKYRRKEDSLFYINESKLRSPAILVDPTWKERNALAALSSGTFLKFQKSAGDFLKKPSKKFFEFKKIDINKLREIAAKKKAEFVHLSISTNKQRGDIAGTKLKKFAKFLSRNICDYFSIIDEYFFYNEKQSADVYFILKQKKEIIKIGPPASMLDASENFRKVNENVFEKNGFLHARVKCKISAKEFIEQFRRKEAKKIKEMGISDIKVLRAN